MKFLRIPNINDFRFSMSFLKFGKLRLLDATVSESWFDGWKRCAITTEQRIVLHQAFKMKINCR
jgi:hypothetical protein